MAGIREVAALAGVGVGTVSRALNNTGHVSKKTREKIEEAVRILNYHPNELARNLYRNRTGMIGVIVPDLENPFFAKFLKCTEIELYKYNYKAVVCNTVEISNRIEDLIGMMEQNVLDGLIVGVDPPAGINVNKIHKPVVSLDRNWGKNIPIVTSDNKKGGALVANTLVNAGCKNVLMFESKIQIEQPFDIRGSEVKRILKENNISVIRADIDWNMLSYEYYLHVVEKYLSIFDSVDAVYAGDLIASACVAIAARKGIRIPEDLKVIGYDGLEISKLTVPVLTTVKQDIPQMAKFCVDSIIRILNGEKDIEMLRICDVELEKGGTI